MQRAVFHRLPFMADQKESEVKAGAKHKETEIKDQSRNILNFLHKYAKLIADALAYGSSAYNTYTTGCFCSRNERSI